MAQLVKNLPAMWETWVQSLGWADPLRREQLSTPVFWPGELHWLYSPWGHKELDMTERLSLSAKPLAIPFGWFDFQFSFIIIGTMDYLRTVFHKKNVLVKIQSLFNVLADVRPGLLPSVLPSFNPSLFLSFYSLLNLSSSHLSILAPTHPSVHSSFYPSLIQPFILPSIHLPIYPIIFFFLSSKSHLLADNQKCK